MDVVGWVGTTEVVRAELPHAVDPRALLTEQGWTVGAFRGSRGRLGSTLQVDLEVTGGPPPGGPVPVRPVVTLAPDVDEDLDLAAVAPVRRQRVAAYAIVSSPRGWLLTELSERTRRAGWWTLPGGGVELGETTAEAVVREVGEESNQAVELGGLLTVVTGHWLGRADGGGVEDYHAVRFVYRAHCPDPRDPVVLDVGGSTRQARWVAGAELAQLPVVDSWAEILPAVTGVAGTFG